MLRYIAKTYAKPFLNSKGELYISWCGEELEVVGLTIEGDWIVLNKINDEKKA